MVCGRCQKRFEDSGLPRWQDRYLLQPLQMLGFCNKLPVGNCREAWILILEFVVRVPFCEVGDMPCGVPSFLWYDDMVCHSHGPADILMRFPQIPEVPVVEKILFVPKPLGTCRVPLQLHQSRSAPALLCGIWRLRPPQGSHEELRELLGLRIPNCPPEPLLIRPSGPHLSLRFRLALGWPCKLDDIWVLRRQVEYPRAGFFYRPWRFRKMKWKVEQEIVERLLWQSCIWSQTFHPLGNDADEEEDDAAR